MSNYSDWILYPDGPDQDNEVYDFTCPCGGKCDVEERKIFVGPNHDPWTETYYPLVCHECGAEYADYDELDEERADEFWSEQ